MAHLLDHVGTVPQHLAGQRPGVFYKSMRLVATEAGGVTGSSRLEDGGVLLLDDPLHLHGLGVALPKDELAGPFFHRSIPLPELPRPFSRLLLRGHRFGVRSWWVRFGYRPRLGIRWVRVGN